MNDSKRLEDIREFKRLLLKKNSEIKKLQRERGEWKREALQQYPTPEAYDAACEAPNKKTDQVASLERVRKASDNFRQDIIENSDGILSDWDSWLDFDAALNLCEREWPK